METKEEIRFLKKWKEIEEEETQDFDFDEKIKEELNYGENENDKKNF